MITCESIMDVLREIPDPEMPISIVDLGIVEDVRIEEPSPQPSSGGPEGRGGKSVIDIDITPTFVGCPALDMIRDDIVKAVGALEGVDSVNVNWIYDPPWSVDRISAAGRESLAAHGVTVPSCGADPAANETTSATMTVPLRTSAVACPFCNSDQTRVDSAFGPTRCRMIYYCDACRNAFEHMKRV